MKVLAATVATFVILVLAFAFVMMSQEDSQRPQVQSTSTSIKNNAPWTGVWVNDGDRINVTAKITTNQIEIILDAKADAPGQITSFLFWVGTFPSTGSKIVSVADTKVLEAEILGSTDKTKEFTLKNGELKFNIGLNDVVKTITLKQ
jgi:hypothetical protein